MASAPTQPSVNERRGRRIAPIQTNFSRPTTATLESVLHPQRQGPAENTPSNGHADERVPRRVKRQYSRTGLRSLFGLEKSIRRPKSDSKLSQVDEVVSQKAATVTGQEGFDATLLSPNGCSTPTTALSMPTFTASSPNGTGSHRATRIPFKSRVRTATSKTPVGKSGWKPPPLFQAYPQAIKHACLPLPVPASLADSILRVHATGTRGGVAKDDQSRGSNSLQNDASVGTAGRGIRRKREGREGKHLRSSSGNVNGMDWTQKIYVLATSGYLLQYSGEGRFDRLPEKIMKLGPKSVAFASDAIPGKPWVLQVSQQLNGEDSSITPVGNGKTRFARFGFHRPLTSRLARTLLLVFNNPEEMNSWLVAVRAEIEVRGGKKYASERPSEADDDDVDHPVRNKPSLRQLVRTGPNQLSEMRRQSQQGASPDGNQAWTDYQSRRASYQSANRQSVISYSGSISAGQSESEVPANGSESSYLSNITQTSAWASSVSLSVIGGSEQASQGQDRFNLSNEQARTTSSWSNQTLQPVHMYPKPPPRLDMGWRFPDHIQPRQKHPHDAPHRQLLTLVFHHSARSLP